MLSKDWGIRTIQIYVEMVMDEFASFIEEAEFYKRKDKQRVEVEVWKELRMFTGVNEEVREIFRRIIVITEKIRTEKIREDINRLSFPANSVPAIPAKSSKFGK